MAFTFRNSVRLLNLASKSENRNAAQERSAPGPHQGEGGQNVSLAQAQRSFANRNDSPLHRDTSLEHAEYHFSKRNPSPVEKCSPITQKSSPLKMNSELVSGAGTMAPKFVDAGAEVKKAFDPVKPKPEVVDLSKGTTADKTTDTATDKTK